MNAYVVVSLLTGARTEELGALTWSRVNLDGNPPTIDLWRSVRAHGDTRTSKSRRTLELPARCVEALTKHRDLVEKQIAEAGRQLEEFDLVFSTTPGTPLDPANVRRAFRRVVATAGMNPMSWTPRELAAQLRIAAVQLRDADRRHRPPRRPCQHPGHQTRVPQGATSCADPRSGRDGCPLPRRRGRVQLTKAYDSGSWAFWRRRS